MKKSGLITGMFFAGITLLIIKLNFNFVFDDSYDAFTSNISSFQFTNFSLFDQHYLGVLLVRDFLKFLQELSPSINVFATTYIFFNVCSLVYFIYTLKTTSLKKINLLNFIIFNVSSLLFLENIISITHTRFASVFTGLALINLLRDKNELKFIILHTMLFTFGFLVRPESGIGSTIIVATACFLFNFNLSKFIKTFIFPFTLVLLFFITLSIHKKFTNRYEILMEPDIEYALSTGRILALSKMETKEDSLRYEMAVNALFIDTNFVSINFLERITKNQFYFDIAKFQDSIKSIIYYYSYYIIFFIYFCIIFIALIFKRKYFLGFKLILYQLFIFILLSYLDYNITIAERHFIGINLIVFAIEIIFFYQYLEKVKLKYLLLVLIFLIISTYISVNNTFQNQIQVYKDVNCLEENMITFESVFKDYQVIVNVNSFHLLDKNYTFKNSIYSENKYYLYDAVNYSIVPRNLRYLSSICDCNAYKAEEFLDWIIQNEVVFLIGDKRSQLIERYMKTVHGIEIKFISHELNCNLIEPTCNDYIALDDFTAKKLIYK